jgi:adhesin transport system membrane fusion protein
MTRTFAILQRELAIMTPLIAQGAVSQIEVLRLQRQSSEMKGNIETAKISIPKVESKIAEANKAMEEVQLTFQNTARSDLNEAYSKIEGLAANSEALMDRLLRTEVRSPVRGTINQILVNTVGGTIQPGMNLVEIVPLEDSLLVEAHIKPSDIAFLRPNQQAKVKFTAYDFTIYGGLDAHLEHIGADSITDKQGGKQQEESYYVVRLRTNQNYLGSKEKPLPIIPGMVVSVDIMTGKKTILSYLLKPIMRAKETALRER